MISKRFLWMLAAAIAALLLVTWWLGSFPARVTIINQSGGDVSEIVVTCADQRIDVGILRNGEVRSLTIPAGSAIELRFRGERLTRWQSQRPLAPAHPIMLYITAGGRVDARDRIGTFTR